MARDLRRENESTEIERFEAPDAANDAPTTEIRPVAVTPSAVQQPTTFGSIVRMATGLARRRIRDMREGLDPRTALHEARRALVVVGVLFLVLAAFLSVAGGLTERRDQRELNDKFRDMLATHAGYATILAKDGTIPMGAPVAVIEIPALHLRQVVVEGTDADRLAQGPGHLRASPLPGQHGNAVIAGRRTTYGGPFRHLDELNMGQTIRVTTAFGHFRYRVASVHIVKPGKRDELGASMRDMLTLSTSDRPYQATQRLVVVSELASRRSTFPDPLRLAKVPANEGSFFGNASAALPALGWDLVLVFVLLGTRALYRRWRAWPTYLISSPIIVAIVFAWLQTMTALLPSTL